MDLPSSLQRCLQRAGSAQPLAKTISQPPIGGQRKATMSCRTLLHAVRRAIEEDTTRSARHAPRRWIGRKSRIIGDTLLSSTIFSSMFLIAQKRQQLVAGVPKRRLVVDIVISRIEI
ncbi:MAG: hypothetical protein AAB263_00595, partial [Planctomycetota bacterium]